MPTGSCLDWTMLPPFAVILCSGLLGATAAYHLDKLNDSTKAHPQVLRVRGYLAIGVASAFAIPLFLHTASSNLIEDAQSKPSLYFVLAGFCVVAAIFSRRFLRTVGHQALRLAEKAEETAEQARIGLEAQSKSIPLQIDRTRRLIQPVSMIEKEDHSGAVRQLSAIVAEDPGDAEAFAWLAYAQKHMAPPDLAGAIRNMEMALQLEPKKPFTWVYNLACYKALTSAPDQEVVSLLRDAWSVAKPLDRARFQSDLKEDEDFATLRSRGKNSEFEGFLREIQE